MDDFDFEVDLELIEYWRGMFAQRRFYLRHEKEYSNVCEKIIGFQLFAEWLCHESTDGFIDGWDVKRFEVKLLEHFAQKGAVSDLIRKVDTEKFDSKRSPSELGELVKWVYGESIEFGYVASDLLMKDKEALIHTAQSMDKSFWSDQVEEFEERIEPVLRKAEWGEGVTVSYETKDWGGPRLFGPNALPAHRLRLYTPQENERLFALMEQSDEPVDFVFGINGIYAEDFNLDVTMREIEQQILLDRFVHFVAEKRGIARDVEAFARRSPEMKSVVSLFKHDQYKNWNKENMGDSGYALAAKTILEHCNSKTLEIEGARFVEEDLKNVKDLLTQYRKVTRILNPILTRVKKQEKAKGPRSSVTAEVSRACGVYLWDSVYVEGQKGSKALDDLAEILGKGDERHLKSETTMYRWLRIIDRCIRENLFLSMVGP